MNPKERLMAVLRKEEPDQIPFTLYVETLKLVGLALYEPWRKLLDQGLSLFAALAVQTHKASCPNANMDIIHHYKNQTSWSPVDLMISMDRSHEITGSIETPVGTDKFFAKVETMDLSQMLPWFPEDGFFIKNLKDYEVFTYLIEDTEYTPFYDDINDFQMIIGNYGYSNPTQFLMDIALDWHLIYRTKSDLEAIFKSLPLSKINVEEEPLGINLFAVIEKEK